jgi:hypothetical protein
MHAYLEGGKLKRLVSRLHDGLCLQHTLALLFYHLDFGLLHSVCLIKSSSSFMSDIMSAFLGNLYILIHIFD